MSVSQSIHFKWSKSTIGKKVFPKAAILIPLTINTKRHFLQLDTGCPRTYIYTSHFYNSRTRLKIKDKQPIELDILIGGKKFKQVFLADNQTKKHKSTEKIFSVGLLGNDFFKDKIFWIFLFICFVTAILFFQLFTTLPLYHNEKFGLTEFQSGLLLSLNGLLIFFLEMPIVSISQRKNIDKLKIILWGSLLMSFSFYVLMINTWAGILIISIIFITFGEMFIFPFSNSFALSRAPKGHEGRYMALFTMSFSLAHIASSKTGLEIIGNFGYQSNWFTMGTLGIIAVGCCIWLQRLVQLENK